MRHARARGFTYLGLVILLAIMALVAAAGLKMGTLLQRAAAEEELLEIGAQFSEALRSYAAATPAGQPTHPPTLQHLLKDPRFPTPRRHLRKIFVDPITGKAEWGVIYLGENVGVLGVYSLSDRRPLKVANFDIRFLNMENREKISDWKFLVAGGEGGLPAVLTPGNSMIGTAPPTAPSLFPPGAPGIDPGKAGPSTGVPGSGNTTGTSIGNTGAAPGKANEPVPSTPPPMPPEQETPEPPRTEEPPVTETPAEEEKEEEQAPEEVDENGRPVAPASIVAPPPPRRR